MRNQESRQTEGKRQAQIYGAVSSNNQATKRYSIPLLFMSDMFQDPHGRLKLQMVLNPIYTVFLIHPYL